MSDGLTTVREVVLQYRGTPIDATRIDSPQGFFEYCKASVQDDSAETFLAVYLDNRNRPIGARVVSRGSATAAIVHPREVYQTALALGAVRVLVAHNHPTGELLPSPEDRKLTERLGLIGQLHGIELLDHLIWNRETGFHSMAEARSLPKPAAREAVFDLVELLTRGD